MAISINDLDDDELVVNHVLEPVVLAPVNDDTFLSDYLKTKGIDDISKIKFEDESGNIEERPWDSLSLEEKYNILNTPLEELTKDDSNDLSNDEIILLNQIRESRLTPQLYIDSLRTNIEPQEPQYRIDDLSDDEIYLLDLESRVGELSDDVAALALATAKQNEELYKKQVDGIRKEYKEREDYQLQQKQAEVEQLQLEAYNQFQDSVISSIDNFNSVGNLDLNFDNTDKDELAQFILSRDEAGNNYLWQALQDPDTLVKAAWFILNGDEAFNSVSDYFINLIKFVSENQYKKGFEEGRLGKQPSRPQVVILPKLNPTRVINSIDDLDDD